MGDKEGVNNKGLHATAFALREDRGRPSQEGVSLGPWNQSPYSKKK